MNLLGPLAALLGIETDAIVERVRRKIVFWSIIGLFGAIAMMFLLLDLYLWLSDIWNPIIAASIIAAGGAVIALITYIVMRMVEGGQKAKEMDRRRANETTALVTTAALTALPVLLRSPLVRTVGLPLAAVAAVALFGRSFMDKRDEKSD
ncbi:MAG TPA: hypothetical protein VGM83_20915 [Devosiaceae bacterium]|jgi:cobalamin synthase